MSSENNEAEQSNKVSSDNTDEIVEREQIDEKPASGGKGQVAPSYWLYCVGYKDNSEKNWEECVADGVMVIGHGNIGDLREYLDMDEIERAVIQAYSYRKEGTKYKYYLDKFCHNIKIGDVVFARDRKYILGKGSVVGEYFYENGEYGHRRKVKWERVCKKEMPDDIKSSANQHPLMSITEKQYDDLLELVKSDSFHDVNPAGGQNNEDEGQASKADLVAQEKSVHYQMDPYSSMLLESKNLILHGAPGTGKTYLAKQIAADIVSNGDCTEFEKLDDEQKKQIKFVQFHPNYDYSDFVEGLRPIMKDGTLGFELKDGIFKKFIDKLARVNYEDAVEKKEEDFEKEANARESLKQFLEQIESGVDVTTFKTKNGREFTIDRVDDDEKNIYISIPSNPKIKELPLYIDDVRKLLESDTDFNKVSDISKYVCNKNRHIHSYYFAICKEIKEIMEQKPPAAKANPERPKLNNYVFIIDEINRGEISKIFGELFFSIDPGYRGRKGEISTQFSNLHNTKEKFYIPENVYIIGTMNDIDRSVDSLDFAMRRRFRFVELKANDKAAAEKMLKSLENDELKAEAIKRMMALNEAIASVPGLNDNYQIGAAYFLKLKTLTFDKLWEDYLQPLLQEYVHGMYDEASIMQKFKQAYDNPKSAEGESDEYSQG